MSDVSSRFARLAAQFSARVDAVPAGAWDNPAPCEGWVARDVVRHMVEWVPGFLSSTLGIELPAGPSVDEDPAGAWHALADGIQGILDDPAVATRTFTHEHIGEQTVEQAIDMIVVGDVLIHTWDLARATGQDETLDAEQVHQMASGMEAFEDAIRNSGQFGPRVEVAADADEQTRLLAFMGRKV
jgi:uncharacterized protein (TIGR03086 family)